MTYGSRCQQNDGDLKAWGSKVSGAIQALLASKPDPAVLPKLEDVGGELTSYAVQKQRIDQWVWEVGVAFLSAGERQISAQLGPVAAEHYDGTGVVTSDTSVIDAGLKVEAGFHADPARQLQQALNNGNWDQVRQIVASLSSAELQRLFFTPVTTSSPGETYTATLLDRLLMAINANTLSAEWVAGLLRAAAAGDSRGAKEFRARLLAYFDHQHPIGSLGFPMVGRVLTTPRVPNPSPAPSPIAIGSVDLGSLPTAILEALTQITSQHFQEMIYTDNKELRAGPVSLAWYLRLLMTGEGGAARAKELVTGWARDANGFLLGLPRNVALHRQTLQLTEWGLMNSFMLGVLIAAVRNTVPDPATRYTLLETAINVGASLLLGEGAGALGLPDIAEAVLQSMLTVSVNFGSLGIGNRLQQEYESTRDQLATQWSIYGDMQLLWTLYARRELGGPPPGPKSAAYVEAALGKYLESYVNGTPALITYLHEHGVRDDDAAEITSMLDALQKALVTGAYLPHLPTLQAPPSPRPSPVPGPPPGV